MPPAITLAEAKEMIRRAVSKGAEVGWISAYAVVDEGGNVIAMGRGDGAPGTAMTLAKAKAVAAARTKAPTKTFRRAHGKAKRHVAVLQHPLCGQHVPRLWRHARGEGRQGCGRVRLRRARADSRKCRRGARP